jgi:nitrogen-specific signal transduction histidine kinase
MLGWRGDELFGEVLHERVHGTQRGGMPYAWEASTGEAPNSGEFGYAQEVAAAARKLDLEYLGEEIPQAIAQSLEGVERVATIVRSMKEFSHPGGREMQPIDLNKALESTLTVSRNEWKYVAEAVRDFDPALPPVTCLPGECNQVFLNLIINAAHAIAEKQKTGASDKGTITVSTRTAGDWVGPAGR